MPDDVKNGRVACLTRSSANVEAAERGGLSRTVAYGGKMEECRMVKFCLCLSFAVAFIRVDICKEKVKK